MAKNPKVKDPTEVALSAIQEALNITDQAHENDPFAITPEPERPQPNDFSDVRVETRPANDDREAMGTILQSIQRGRPRRSAFFIGALFSILWIAAAGLLGFAFLPAIKTMIGSDNGGILALVGLACAFAAPLVLFYFLASIVWRSQELSLIAQSMAQMAVRFSEPENVANGAIVSVGQAIRREVAAMGDGVERAIARAGELEVLVTNEVAALERAYGDNEVRIRALLQDISVQRDNLVGQAEQVRNAISGVQVDLRQDIALISDAIAARVDDATNTITQMLDERSQHITSAFASTGDNMIIALGERGGDLLDRLEEASSQTAQAVLEASEQLSTSLNLKTGSIHDEFTDLADNIQALMSDRIERIVGDFEQRSNTIVDGITSRTEQVHDTLKNSGDSLLNEMDLRSADLVAKVDEAGNRLAQHILSSGDKAGEALDVTVNALVAKVVSQTESSHETLAERIGAFENLLKEQGSELAEKFTRDSGTLGALITRHVAEFDRTVKTFGGEIVERMAEHTQGVSDGLRTYVDSFDSRVSSHGETLRETIDERLGQFQSALESRITTLDVSLDSKIKTFDDTVETRLSALENSFDNRAAAVTQSIDTQSIALSETLSARFGDMQKGLESHANTVASDIEARVGRFESLLDLRVDAAASRVEASGLKVGETLQVRAEELTQSIQARVEDTQRSLATLATETSDVLQTGARAAQQALLSLSGEVGSQLRTTTSDLEHAIRSAAHEAEGVLSLTSTNAGAQLKSVSVEVEHTLQTTVQNAESVIAAMSNTASENIKSASAEIERTVLATVRDAETALLSASDNASTQIRAASAEIERTVSTTAHDAEAVLTAASGSASTQIKSSAAEIERAIGVSTEAFGLTLNSKVLEITDGVREQTERLAQIVDERQSPFINALSGKNQELITALDTKSQELVGAFDTKRGDLTAALNEATSTALKAIETHGGDFTVSLMNSSSDIARQITSASEVATGSISKALKDVETSTRAAIDQSRQVATAAVTEMQETSKILRTDTVALFERLREGNILLQEVLTGAHENLNSLERALVTRVADFVTTLNDVTARNGASTNALGDQLRSFTDTTTAASVKLGELSTQFLSHGRVLSDAVHLVESTNERAGQSISERQQLLEEIASSIDGRTAELDDRLTRFTTLLDESLSAAEARARDISRVVAESAGASSSAVGRQFEAVRMAVEDERRQTIEAMSEIYDRGTQDAAAMFQGASERFSAIVLGMKQMAAELHQELDATRNDLRRGVFELPQETAESTAQMRKVIVDQIEALAELNRIVAKHGRGLDVAPANRSQREEEPVLAVASTRVESRPAPAPAPRARDFGSASSLPLPDLGAPAPARRTEAPSVSPTGGDRDAWLSDLLNRADDDQVPVSRARVPQPRQPAANPLDALSLDITRLVDRDLAAEMWDRYQRGERKAFNKRLYTPAGQKAFDEVARKYRAERPFKQTVDRYITEFERLLDDVSRDERGPAALRGHLTSETGLVYTLLAHAAGRLG